MIAEGLAACGERIEVQVVQQCASTNTEMLQRKSSDPSDMPLLLLAEQQTAGRGRRGRRWHAEPGAALTFTLRWDFEGDASRLRGLSLAVGVAIANALHALGAGAVRLKWPNDLLATMGNDGGKLGGILIETRSSGGRIAAAIGVGLNYRRMPSLQTRLKRSIASLEEALDPLPARNLVAVRIVDELAKAMRVFAEAGFDAFRLPWQALHANQGEPLRVRMAGGRVLSGIADGVAADGGLLLRTRSGMQCIHSGTVVRPAPARAAAPTPAAP
jgi:BirA family transcriptional regulator, biotin operon repressor / biotin---[acetyl-CoA-carboxylase] ligase